MVIGRDVSFIGIIDKHVVIQPGTVIGHDPEEDANRFETTEDGIVVIPKGLRLAEGLKILVITSELGGFSKSGGLADAVGALSQQLVRMGHDLGVITPAYASVEQCNQAPRSGLWGCL